MYSNKNGNSQWQISDDKSEFHLSVESNLRLIWFFITKLSAMIISYSEMETNKNMILQSIGCG